MNVLSGPSSAFPDHFIQQVANYRHRVFIELLGWQMPNREALDLELDQFDRDDTVYVVAHDAQRRINGCARLLPTTRPYLLGEVFPQLLNGLPPPCTPEVWELSRFAAVDFNGHSAVGRGQFSSDITLALLHEAVACAAGYGAKRLITVSPVGVERLLRKTGLRSHRAGPPMVIDGHPLFACWIEIDG